MKVTLKLTRVGMTMEEATLVRWAKLPGETFVEGEVLYEIETEKVTQEVEAPGTGTLVEILAPEGSEIAVGDDVCVVEAEQP